MIDALIELVRDLPPSVATMALATLPFTELRGAIPVGMLVFGIDGPWAAVYALIGNMAIVLLLLATLDPATRMVRAWGLADRVVERVFVSTRRRHGPRFERYRDLALIGFVAVPLPGTGGWAGALAAFLFGVRLRRAFPLIAAGLIASAAVVTVLVSSGRFVVGIVRP